MRWNADFEIRNPMPQPPSPAGRGGSPYPAADVTSSTRPRRASSDAGQERLREQQRREHVRLEVFVEQPRGVSRNAVHVAGPDVAPVLHQHVDASPLAQHGVGGRGERGAVEQVRGQRERAAPAASICAPVADRLPGSGFVFEARSVDECSRRSPSFTVRAVIATSKPARARCTAQAFPIPRLAAGHERHFARHGFLLGTILDV